MLASWPTGSMQQNWPPQGARRRRVFLWRLAIACALAACNTPTWVTLRPKCPDGGGGANCGDAGTPQQAQPCKEDLECGSGQLCLLGACRACDTQKPECPTCEPGSAPLASSVNGCSVCRCSTSVCKTHAECALGSVCEGNKCVPCDASAASKCPQECPWSWKAQPLKRNGCAQCECAPPSACQADTDCGTGLRCYRGQLCQQDCTELGCCFGNFCSQPGCEDPPSLSCSLVGCAEGICTGDATCDPSPCKCDGKTFECATVDCTNSVCKF